MTVTPKELFYLEDSLGMEQQLKMKCNEYAGKVEDPQLKSILSELAMCHQKRFDHLFSQLN